jgi:small subunit ribosomal protein S23
MRKLATQVPEQVSRLLKATHMHTPPTWYIPVLTNPPPVHSALRSRSRRILDETKSAENIAKINATIGLKARAKPMSVIYKSDTIRRQFFRDFPFEALRPSTLVEGREVDSERGIEGQEWKRLEQRGAFPTVEE